MLFPGVFQQAVPVCANQAAHSLNEPCSVKLIEQAAYVPVAGKVFPEGYAACFAGLCPFAGHKPLVDDEAYVGKEHGHGGITLFLPEEVDDPGKGLGNVLGMHRCVGRNALFHGGEQRGDGLPVAALAYHDDFALAPCQGAHASCPVFHVRSNG